MTDLELLAIYRTLAHAIADPHPEDPRWVAGMTVYADDVEARLLADDLDDTGAVAEWLGVRS
jgi:hypothetical protein